MGCPPARSNRTCGTTAYGSRQLARTGRGLELMPLVLLAATAQGVPVSQKGEAVVDCRDVRLLRVQLQLRARKGLSGRCQGVFGLLSRVGED